jgi:hypothetical protein
MSPGSHHARGDEGELGIFLPGEILDTLRRAGFGARTVSYYGCRGEVYVEEYPAVPD